MSGGLATDHSTHPPTLTEVIFYYILYSSFRSLTKTRKDWEVATKRAATVATLGPAVRLVVFKFLMRSELVPDYIPRLPSNRSSVAPAYNGTQVLPSTPDVWLADLRAGLLNTKGDYAFVGARVADERTNTKRKVRRGGLVEIVEVKISDVRFTFCRRRHLTDDPPPHENFVERFSQLVNTFVDFTKSNLWMTEAYLNPYLNKDGTTGKGSVLMIDCAGRKSAVNPDGTPIMVFEGGREKSSAPGMIGQGIGPKISILNKASELKLVGKNVQLITR
ncbi:MAG: hypothetical protein A3A13_02765 [Candidatus Yanofskybacteria bacterium RIFCSPLOWO2_01_FULL_43_22]|uniref:Uncharacterized protein n=1 Tax=Candidatus Yanofskybacteria bacterium RIFCSPLOWO2_01_FULL_43_22 TaxID=1802695 RepID=A0A1F8GF75_9BACT|nr:MAG: hypothetical protein A3D48_03490 [Candidatus Yanofskybacteria bacterium RIFCSPHIGHO2_02_FULL_43_17]OGN23973.1 MAG: hypothetical protein A3A13_02765 [Candidatus Yanofskybacteria bacterium RIFCSPLOWO2_01_FULL_43_22]